MIKCCSWALAHAREHIQYIHLLAVLFLMDLLFFTHRPVLFVYLFIYLQLMPFLSLNNQANLSLNPVISSFVYLFS